MMASKINYPFTAIVGQKTMKTALILNIINPKIGGVLIRGEKGTAKSTAVRGLSDLLPEVKIVEDCVFQCQRDDQVEYCEECRNKLDNGEKLRHTISKMKVVELPVSATEDRIAGTIDIEHTLKKGEKKFEPGVLASANGNILYIDEVNLLDDHLVDILLDAAAMGVNFIEREGISFTHPSKFILVGTMNPEEGDLRPQLIDRFGLSVEISGEKQTETRVEVIKRRLAFEDNPRDFFDLYQKEQEALTKKIMDAKERLPHVKIADSLYDKVCSISLKYKVDGHRADIAMIKTSLTLAAFNGRESVCEDDITEAASLVLPHRLRKQPFDNAQFDL